VDKISQPRVAVQILAWNQVDEVITCLRSFSCIDYTNYEVILVYDGSVDNTIEVIKRDYPQVTGKTKIARPFSPKFLQAVSSFSSFFIQITC